MSTTLVAVPSCAPGGIDAPVSEHFGHCDLFTLVEIDDGEVVKVDSLPGVAHQHGGCMVPVELLANRGVKILIAGGMGMRPLRASARSASKSTRMATPPTSAKRFKRSWMEA